MNDAQDWRLAYFDDIIDVLSDGIYISDRNGLTLKVNKRYEQLTGFRREDLIGRTVTELKSEGVFDVILNPGIVQTGQPQTAVQITKTNRQLVLNGYPVFDQDGKVALVVTFVRDVTVLSALREQLAYQKELIEKYQRDMRYLLERGKTNGSFIAESPDMQRVLKCLQKVAVTDATVLILGETGVGKDVLARKVHEASLRADRPFFKVDCSTIPANLFESELFGYEPGAFSGAAAKGKPGFFELADGGTLFLDEIGELPLELQAKLLRVLQDQEIIRVGSTRVKKVDVRIIAATNRDLEEAVANRTFRRDLFYRLQVAVLNVPPLRERQADIMPLAQFFLQKFNQKYKKSVTFAPETTGIFAAYRWPGNVREMENLIQRLVLTSESGVIGPIDLPTNMVCGASADNLDKKIILPCCLEFGRPLGELLGDVEKELLKVSLMECGSVAAAAQKLQVDRVTIYRKLKKYGLIAAK